MGTPTLAVPASGGLPGVTRLLERYPNWSAFACGLLSAAALPPFNLVFVLLLTIPGLLVTLHRATRLRAAFARGFWFGFGINLVGLYWITEAILIEAARFWWFVPLAVPGLSVIMALFTGFSCGLAWFARPGWPRLVALAGAWVIGDIGREFIGTGFPWNLLGSVWEIPGPLGDIFIQPAAWISVHGLTAATILLAGLPTLGRRACIGGAAALACWAGAGLWRLSSPALPAPGVEVVLVQGNIAEGQKWDRATAIRTFEHHLALTQQGVTIAAAKNPAARPVVIWPETASPFQLGTDTAARDAIAAAANTPDPKAGGISGLIGSVRFDDGPRNSLFALRPDGSIAGIYDKWHLVPGGEFQPSWLPGVQIVPGGGFHAGTGPATLRLPDLPPVGPLICYEAIYPGQVIDEADRPDWIANATNDAWFGNSTGPRQHLAAARMRAVEEGLPLVRAANTGISAAFDAFGREQARLEIGVAGTLVVPLPGKLPQTLFGHLGLIIPALIAAMLVAVGLLGTFWQRAFRSNKTHVGQTSH